MTIKNWFNSLLGKPPERANIVPGAPQNEEPKLPSQNPQTQYVKEVRDKVSADEDSVLKDLSVLKNFLGGKLNKASAGAGAKSRELTDRVKSSNKAMKFVKTIGVIFALLIIALLATSFIKKTGIGFGNNEEEKNQTEKPSPTPINYEPERPSVYAEDVEVLRIEEAIDSLEKEISRASLRESGLIPPVLDYNINFKSQ